MVPVPSKEDIWYAVYDEALATWPEIIFDGVRAIEDPLLRIEKTVENHLNRYLGGDVFDGGCFFVNMLVELSGQSAAMSRHLFRGFVGYSRLIKAWLAEAGARGELRSGLDFKDVANFILISLNGAATFYIASRDPLVLRQTEAQLRFYIRQLRNGSPMPSASSEASCPSNATAGKVKISFSRVFGKTECRTVLQKARDQGLRVLRNEA